MRNRKAFSLVEIMVAIICLAVVLIPLTTMFSAGSSDTIHNRNDILARQHTANLLDYAYSLAYSDTFLLPGNNRAVPSVSFKAGSEDITLDMEDIFSRSISVEEIKPANWRYSYKLIKVSVEWQENKNIKKEITMTGVVSDEST